MNLLLKRGMNKTMEDQAGFVALESLKKPWVSGFIVHKGRTIPRVRDRLSASDRLGGIKARWDIGRGNYRVVPGLYASGEAKADSPVFVTANYKMSFDALRSSLRGIDGWILVLDTKGINVWCAAGKGSFGTAELVSRIAKLELGKILTHRSLVLPQLGASAVSAPEVARLSGFRVEWGPVRASDIGAWLDAGRRKTEAMREVSFRLRERLTIAPVELVHSWPLALGALAVGALYGLPPGPDWVGRASVMTGILIGAIPVSTVLFPALLPWLPTRAFAVKGAILGAAWSLGCALVLGLGILPTLGAAFLSTTLGAFLGMNFTGSSTFTCQPGALLEVERGFWPMVAGTILGIATLTASRLIGL